MKDGRSRGRGGVDRWAGRRELKHGGSRGSACRFPRRRFDYHGGRARKGEALRYLLLVCVDPSAEPFDPAQGTIAKWVARHDANGTRVLGHRLADRAEARTVRERQGRLLVANSPFAETKEWIAAFDLLDCASLEEPVRIASQHPMARFGRIEVRPFRTED